MNRTSLIASVLAVVALLGAAGCEDDPVFIPEVTNVNDNFHFKMEDVKNHDTTMVYFWHMLGSTANIDQSADLKGGSVSITVADSALVQVYNTDLRQTGSYTTASGLPGWWRITIVLRRFSGTIDFWALRKQ